MAAIARLYWLRLSWTYQHPGSPRLHRRRRPSSAPTVPPLSLIPKAVSFYDPVVIQIRSPRKLTGIGWAILKFCRLSLKKFLVETVCYHTCVIVFYMCAVRGSLSLVPFQFKKLSVRALNALPDLIPEHLFVKYWRIYSYPCTVRAIMANLLISTHRSHPFLRWDLKWITVLLSAWYCCWSSILFLV